MIFNVSQLMREHTGATRDYTVDDEICLPLEGEPFARVQGSVHLVRTPRGLVAQAELDAEPVGVCSRCLGPAAIPLHMRVDEEFLPVVDPVTGARVPVPEDGLAFQIDEHHHIDLTDAVRQAAALVEPMAPLCRPDCRGLCPECGADLNVNPCRCEAPTDDRWALLRKLDVS